MVTANPLFRGKWNARKFQATVINDVWLECLFFSSVAAGMRLAIRLVGLDNDLNYLQWSL